MSIRRHTAISGMALRQSCCHVFFLLATILIESTSIAQAARLKDIADIEGVRNNDLIGYGIVVGLNGTGDGSSNAFTAQGLANMLERLGVRVDAKSLKLANVAGVTVTASLPPFARPGSKLDVTLSSVGDASSLQGGFLVMTPLKGADGKVYAVSQGPVSIGGFSVEGGGNTAQKNHPTIGRIANGASVERAIPFDLFASGQIRILLRDPDFTTAVRIEKAVNDVFSSARARALDSGNVVVPLNPILGESPIEMISRLEDVSVQPDVPARVVVNERTGTIIMGEQVKVSTVAVAHGNLNITISSEVGVSQPQALAQGQTAVVENQDLEVGEESGQMSLIKEAVSLKDVVEAVNNLGASPRDLIAILQALKRAGALQAELVVM